MIKELTLKNFRQHKDLTLHFNAGVTVIRAANEAGKSTVFEAVAYALFGARAARNSDLATWGQPENSQEVRLTFDIDGIEYRIKRNARSAEINYDGGRVSGQNDTARFCEQLLDLKPNTGARLMFVPQNEIRGTLAEGGAKTTTMIEQLAELGQVDELIERLQQRWNTGKTGFIEQTLSATQQQLDDAQGEFAEMPNPDMVLSAKRQKAGDERQAAEGKRKVAVAAVERLSSELSLAAAAEQELERLEREAAQLAYQIEALDKTLSQDAVADPSDELSAARAELDALMVSRESYADYQTLAGWEPAYRRQGTRETLTDELDRKTVECRSTRKAASDLQADIRSLSQQISHDLACPTCKRSWDDAAARKQRNAELQQQIQTLEVEEVGTQKLLAALEADCSDLSLTLAVRIPELAANSRWYVVDEECYPPLFQWQGEVPQQVSEVDVRRQRDTVVELEKQAARFALVREQKAGAARRKTEAERQMADVQRRLRELPDGGRRSSDIRVELHDAQREQQEAERSLKELDAFDWPAFEAELRRPFERLRERIAQLQGQVAKQRRQLDETRKANALLKALRSLKPKVANQVWDTVCQTASHYFSVMRGMSSVIGRDGTDFTADGRDMSSLSGSAQDVLGLALRIALTKTFLPTCPFLLLDEPFAAADDERTQKALGFLTSAGFAQTIIITHEDSSEAVADHLITL